MGSTGVYYPYLNRGLDETTMPHTTMVDPKDGSESFGVQKARCEEIVRAAFGKGSIRSDSRRAAAGAGGGWILK